MSNPTPKQVEIWRKNKKRPYTPGDDGEPMVSRRVISSTDPKIAGKVLIWKWWGGEYLSIHWGEDDESGFEVINTTDKNGELIEFTARNFAAEIKSGPSVAELIENYKAQYGTGWNE